MYVNIDLRLKVIMERQIRANDAVIDTQKSSYKYIHHNPIREFRTFWLHTSHLHRLKLYIEVKLIFFYIVNAPIKHQIVMLPYLTKREGLSSNVKR